MQNEIMAIARQLHVEYDFYFEKLATDLFIRL